MELNYVKDKAALVVDDSGPDASRTRGLWRKGFREKQESVVGM